jgi:glycosyltransferase involved in cell wall biosynthesis
MPNQETTFVSVCIPVYNGENFILSSIKSALEQKYSNFELLIVDNCSTDRTANIVSELKDPRVRYVRNEKNIGSIGNFNKCIELAQGEYFLLLPHDDLLLPEGLVQFVKGLEDPTVGFVYSSIRVVNADGKVTYNKVNHTIDKLFTSEEIVKDIVDNFVPIQLAMARTSVLQSLGGFDIKYGLFCDAHLWLKVAFDGWKAFYHKGPLFCHRIHADQGQIAFLRPNLKTLSGHWGKNLDKKFWKENSYNHLFLKLSHFLLLEMKTRNYDTSQAKIMFLKIFVRSHLRSMLVAMVQLNFSVLVHDLSLIKPLVKQYSFRNVLLCYLLVTLNETVTRLSNKLKFCLI